MFNQWKTNMLLTALLPRLNDETRQVHFPLTGLKGFGAQYRCFPDLHYCQSYLIATHFQNENYIRSGIIFIPILVNFTFFNVNDLHFLVCFDSMFSRKWSTMILILYVWRVIGNCLRGFSCVCFEILLLLGLFISITSSA